MFSLLSLFVPYCFRNDVLDIARAYYKNIKHQDAGAPLPRQNENKKVSNPKIAPKLEQILLRDNIKSLQIMCMKNYNTDGDEWHVTCFAQGNESFEFAAPNKKWKAIERGIIKKLEPAYI